MGDTATRVLQLALEGIFTRGGGAGSVYNAGSAVPATRQLALNNDVGADWVPVFQEPAQARNSYDGRVDTLLHMISGKGKFSGVVYPDDLFQLARMSIGGTVSFVTLPNTPAALLAATAIAATMSLTSQPNAQADAALAKILAVTLSNSSAASSAAVNVTITGTDVFGNPLVEIVAFPQGTNTPSATIGVKTTTLYTQNYFKTVTASGIATSAQPANDLVAVGGVNAFYYTFKPDKNVPTLYSATGEYWDGSIAWQLPGIVLEKLEFAIDMGKDFGWTSEFVAMSKLQLAAATGSRNPAAALGTQDALTNLTLNAMPGITTQDVLVYIDPIGTTPGTSGLVNFLTSYKLSLNTGAKLGKAANATKYASYVGRDQYGPLNSAEVTLLADSWSGAGASSPDEVRQFLLANSRTMRVAAAGAVLPCGALSAASDWPAMFQDASSHGGYYGISFDMAGKWTDATEAEVDGVRGFTYKLSPEVDLTSMQRSYQVGLVSRINPNFV